MTTREKALALNALSRLSLELDCNNQWFVNHQRVDIKEIDHPGVICSVTGRGDTPEDAIEDHWHKMTASGQNLYIVVNALHNSRRHVRWNGFMWEDLPK